MTELPDEDRSEIRASRPVGRRPSVAATGDIESPSQGASVSHESSSLALEDVVILGLALGLCLAHGLSMLTFPTFTPRMGLLLMAGVPGLVYLARAVRAREMASLVATAVLVWTVFAALVGGTMRLSLVGTVGRELSGLVVTLVFGIWAFGRGSSRRAVELLPSVLMLGLGVSAFVGFVQFIAGIESGAFALQDSRASGLTPNPVFFGALMAAGAAIAAAHPSLGLGNRVGLVSVFGAAVNLSGSRSGLIAGILAVFVVSGWPVRSKLRQWLALPVGYLVGVGAGALLAALTAGARSSTDRLVSTEGGGRTTAWKYGVEAVLDRPFHGWGFGRFRAATQHRYSSEFVRDFAPDDLTQAWFDPHNVVLLGAVAVGLVGLVLIAAWLVLAGRMVHGPLTGALVALGFVMLLQPAGLAVLPLAMLILGCAARIRRTEQPLKPNLGFLAALTLGVAAAGWLAIGDLRLKAAIETGQPTEIQEAAEWFPGDAVVADLVAQAWFNEAATNPDAERHVIEWSERAISAEPDRPYFHAQFAGRLLALGDFEGSRSEVEAALELQPWHLRALAVAYFLADRAEDPELKAYTVERLCELRQPIDECA